MEIIASRTRKLPEKNAQNQPPQVSRASDAGNKLHAYRRCTDWLLSEAERASWFAAVGKLTNGGPVPAEAAQSAGQHTRELGSTRRAALYETNTITRPKKSHKEIKG